jgi:putative addiction module component (TIGR02574 family)
MGKVDLTELLKLAAAERLEIAERLLESVADDVADAPLSDAERAYVIQRLSEHEASPHDTVPWSEVKKALDA